VTWAELQSISDHWAKGITFGRLAGRSAGAEVTSQPNQQARCSALTQSLIGFSFGFLNMDYGTRPGIPIVARYQLSSSTFDS
jgi:hypothetical protein